MYCLTVLEARSLKSRCQQGYAPSKGSRENLLHAKNLSWLLAVVSNPWHSLVCGSVPPTSACHQMAIFLLCDSVSLLGRTPALWNEGPTLLQCALILIITPATTLFPNNVTFWCFRKEGGGPSRFNPVDSPTPFSAEWSRKQKILPWVYHLSIYSSLTAWQYYERRRKISHKV